MPQDNTNLSPTTMETHACHYPDADVIDSVEAMNNPELIKFTEDEKVTVKGQVETLVTNLFSGPGAGKSTTAAGIFFDLKTCGINCELVTEFAKDLVYEQRHHTFTDQIYIFGKQYHRIQRLMGQVSVIVTDSPLLLTPVYDSEKRPTLEKLAVEEHNKMWTYNVFLKRKKPFNPKGRIHGEEHAKDIDYQVADMLLKHEIAFETFDGTIEGKDAIVKKILMLLEWKEKGE
jgi:hypothetical protein